MSISTGVLTLQQFVPSREKRMKQTRKLVSGRVLMEDFRTLRDYCFRRGESQDAVITRWVTAQLKRLRRHQPQPEQRTAD